MFRQEAKRALRMYMFRSLSNDTVKKCDTHVCTSFFDFFQTLIRRKLLGNWLNRYVKRLQKFNRTLSKRIVGETTVIPRASLFPSLCLLRVLFFFLWPQRGSYIMIKIIIKISYIIISNWVCHHHLLSLVNVFTCLLCPSLLLDV